MATAESTKPLTFNAFLEKMRDPTAGDLVRAIKGFIEHVSRSPADPDNDARLVQSFMDQTEAHFRGHSLWAGASEEELDASGEGLEKYLMTKLHARTFGSSALDKQQDAALTARLEALGAMVTPEHLDIPARCHNEATLLIAQKELHKINQYKAPRDKLVCVLNCCRVVNNLLNVSSGDTPPGADDFLPVLIYVTLRANPQFLASNLVYIGRFRKHSRLTAESAYFYTNLVSTVAFLESCTADQLTGIDAEEFARRVPPPATPSVAMSLGGGPPPPESPPAPTSPPPSAAAAATTPPPQDGATTASTAAAAAVPSTPPPAQPQQQEQRLRQPREATEGLAPDSGAAEGVEEVGADALVADGVRSEAFAARHRFMVATSGDLTLRDVDALLLDYKQLVLRYEALRRGVGIVVAGSDGGPPAPAAGAPPQPGGLTPPPAGPPAADHQAQLLDVHLAEPPPSQAQQDPPPLVEL